MPAHLCVVLCLASLYAAANRDLICLAFLVKECLQNSNQKSLSDWTGSFFIYLCHRRMLPTPVRMIHSRTSGVYMNHRLTILSVSLQRRRKVLR